MRLDPLAHDRLSSLSEEVEHLHAERNALEAEAARLTITAQQTGLVLDLLPDLKPDIWLSSRQQLATLRADGKAQAVAYVAEDELERIAVGARFRTHKQDSH